ncbi:hypothetical protein MKX01_016662 [Papaver californicum]|nr:hypothetical protein MKX01_016662 [Papaver californicum]
MYIASHIWILLQTGILSALTGRGFESLYKQTFNTTPNEKLKKSFACYLSTSIGPFAGTLYFLNVHIAFCSDRPLTVMVPIAMVSVVNPVNLKASKRYIQINTVDNYDFRLMGFVNYDKAVMHLCGSMSEFVAHQISD